MPDARAMTSAEQVFSRTDSCTMGFRFRFWHRAVNADEAERQLCKFEAKWPKYPAIPRLWREHWERVIPFFKIIRTRGSCPAEEAAMKLLWLALSKVVAKWESVQYWKQMLNYPDAVCSDRIREAGVRQ